MNARDAGCAASTICKRGAPTITIEEVVEVLRACAAGAVDAPLIATLALRSLEIPFARWCA